MDKIFTELKKIAPYIAANVNALITAEMSDDEMMEIVHQQIIAFFIKQQKCF